MNLSQIYTKTSKGILESNARSLTREHGRVLSMVDGKTTVGEILEKNKRLSQNRLAAILDELAAAGLVRAANVNPSTQHADDFGFSSTIIVAEANTQAFFEAQAEMDRQFARQTDQDLKAVEAERANLLAEVKADIAAEAAAIKRDIEQRRMEEDAADRARQERESKAERASAKAEKEAAERAQHAAQRKAAAEEKARAEADAKLKAAEAARVKAEQEAKAREADAVARAQAEKQAREQAERQARSEAQARREAEQKAKAEAEAKALLQAEAAQEAKLRAEMQVKLNALEAAQRRAEEQADTMARQLEEARLAAELEARAKRRLEARAKEEAEARERAEAETRAKLEQESRLRAEAEAKAQEEAEARRQAEFAAQAQLEIERVAREEAERKAREEALAKERAEDERRRAEEAAAERAEQARREAEAAAQEAIQAERQAREQAEARARDEAEQRRSEQAAAERAETERQAREQAEQNERKEAELRRQAQATAERAEAERLAREASEARARAEAAARQAELEAELELERQAREEAEARARIETEAREREEARRLARESAEAQARAEAEEAQRRVDEEQRQEQEEEQRLRDEAGARAKAAAEQAAVYVPPRRRMDPKWIRYGAGGAVLSLLALLGLAHVLSFNFYLPTLESQLERSLGQRVSVQTLHFSAFPAPHWIMEGVTIGSAQEVRVARIDLTPTLDAWFGAAKQVRDVEIQSAVLTLTSLDLLPRWRKAQAAEAPFQFGEIHVRDSRWQIPDLDLFAFNADIEQTKGVLSKIEINSVDQRVRIDVVPQGDTAKVEINATRSVLPFAPRLEFDRLKLAGVARSGGFAVSEIDGDLFGGSVSGTGELTWGAQWKLTADVAAKQVSLQPALAAVSRELRVTGLLDAKARVVAASPQFATLLDAPQVQATFRAKDGEISNLDLVGALHAASRGVGITGGKTHFNDLAGYLRLTNGRYEYQQLKLGLGVVSASGGVAANPDRSLSGNLVAELRSRATTMRVPLSLSGHIGAPTLKASGGASAAAIRRAVETTAPAAAEATPPER